MNLLTRIVVSLLIMVFFSFVIVPVFGGPAFLIGVGLIIAVFVLGREKVRRCAGCGEKVGRKHKATCHRRGIVTMAAVDEVKAEM
ncbi:MAG: hypothetical protein WB579_09675 [Bryobacteraceae bacterium]